MHVYPLSCTTLLLSYGLLLHHRAQSIDCDADEAGVAIISCQHERESLSDASQLNNTTQLCQALQKYSDCIEPKIAGCTGDVLMAFRIIKQKYSAEPYNCHVNDFDKEGHAADEDNYLEQHQDDGDHFNPDDNHILPSTQPEQFAGVTVAGLPGESKKSMTSKPPPAETDMDEGGGVNSSPSHRDNSASITALLISTCLLHLLRLA